MEKLKKYWHLLCALLMLLLFALTEMEAFKHLYRAFIAFGLAKAGLKGLNGGKFQRNFAIVLFLLSAAMVSLSVIELLGLRGIAAPEWVWIAARAVIDPIYYVYLPYLDRKRDK